MDPKYFNKTEVTVAQVEVEIQTAELPKEWKFANEMRNNSIGFQNKSVYELVNNLMRFIQETSDLGGLGGKYEVRGGRYEEVYERAQEILVSLGYKVEGSTKLGNNRYWSISW